MKRFLLILFFGVVIIFCVAEFPIFVSVDAKDFQKKMEAAETIELSGKTLFISDFHFQDPETKISFDVEGVEHIVIVGDLFDSTAHYRIFGEARDDRFQNALARFLPNNFEGDVYFISAYTHDPDVPEFEMQGPIEFRHLGKLAVFTINGERVLVFHGNELHDGWVGGGVSVLGTWVNLPLPLERFARIRLDIPEDTWVITGHSHVPALHRESKTANTGSFAGVPFNEVLRIPVGTGIIFEEGEIYPVQFEDIIPTRYP